MKDALAAGYAMSTRVRAVHRRALHEHRPRVARSTPRTRRSCCTTGTTPDSKIVGLSYLVWHHNGPPPGFAGPNDRWHQHNANGGLCLKGAVVVAGEESTRQQCAALGGRKTLLTDIWMVHAWVVPGIACDWGVVQRRVPEPRRPPRRHRVRRPVPEQDLLAGPRGGALSRAATTPRCAAAGSPSRRALRARRASTCPGPSRGAGSSRVNRPGSRSGKSTRCHRITSRRRGAPSAAWNTAEQREQRAFRTLLETRRVVRARLLEVGVELAFVRPRAVFHVERGVVLARRRSAPSRDRCRASATSRPAAATCPSPRGACRRRRRPSCAGRRTGCAGRAVRTRRRRRSAVIVVWWYARPVPCASFR